MFVSALTLLLATSASAAEPTALPTPVTQTLSADSAQEFKGSVYVNGRGSIAMPSGSRGVAVPTSIGLGARWEDGTRLGMRGMFMPNPPDVFYASPGPVAGGLVVDYAHHFPVSRNTTIYPLVSAGVLLAVDDFDGANVVLPVTEAGIGMEFTAPTGSGHHVTFAPEIGVVPFLLAPYAAFNVGMHFDGHKN